MIKCNRNNPLKKSATKKGKTNMFVFVYRLVIIKSLSQKCNNEDLIYMYIFLLKKLIRKESVAHPINLDLCLYLSTILV